MVEEISRQLTEVVSILKLAFAREIHDARQAVLEDPVNAAVLEALEDAWMPSGQLQAAVSHVAKVTDRTVRDHLATLLAMGAIRARGNGRAREYSRSGLI